MKKIIIFSITLIALLSACDKDFLELSPISEASVDTYLSTPGDYEVAVNAIYSELQSGDQYGSSFFHINEVRGDNVVNNNPGASAGVNWRIDQFQDSPANETLRNVWASLYRGIFRSNIVLDQIETFEMEQSQKDQLMGEAMFLRALSYFNLVMLWGEVPVITEPLVPEKVRATAQRDDISTVYQAIIDDLTNAADLLPPKGSYSDADMGRATSGAANALLGRIYLSMREYGNCIAALRKVVGYSLLSNVADVFDVNNKMNDEIIFAIRYQKGVIGQDHGLWIPTNNGSPIIVPSLYDEFDPNDDRLDLITYVPVPGIVEQLPAKYYDEPVSGSLGNDFPVIRYADVVLMLAEALNEEGYVADGEAFDLINETRNRAGLADLTSTDLPDQSSFREAVFMERRLELALENVRWFDLLRQGNAFEAVMEAQPEITSIASHRLIYPIPLNEINAFNDDSRFPQNPDY